MTCPDLFFGYTLNNMTLLWIWIIIGSKLFPRKAHLNSLMKEACGSSLLNDVCTVLNGWKWATRCLKILDTRPRIQPKQTGGVWFRPRAHEHMHTFFLSWRKIRLWKGWWGFGWSRVEKGIYILGYKMDAGMRDSIEVSVWFRWRPNPNPTHFIASLFVFFGISAKGGLGSLSDSHIWRGNLQTQTVNLYIWGLTNSHMRREGNLHMHTVGGGQGRNLDLLMRTNVSYHLGKILRRHSASLILLANMWHIISKLTCSHKGWLCVINPQIMWIGRERPMRQEMRDS